jgi:hypothetical protein
VTTVVKNKQFGIDPAGEVLGKPHRGEGIVATPKHKPRSRDAIDALVPL